MNARNEAVVLEGPRHVSATMTAGEALELMDGIMSTPYATTYEDDLTWLARDVFSTPYGG